MIIKGWGLSTRPDVNTVEPNDLFIDLETSKKYIVEDGAWHEIPYSGQDLSAYAKKTDLSPYAKKTDLPTVMPNQLDSEAGTIAALRGDFNTLLAALKTAGLMEVDPPTPPESE